MCWIKAFFLWYVSNILSLFLFDKFTHKKISPRSMSPVHTFNIRKCTFVDDHNLIPYTMFSVPLPYKFNGVGIGFHMREIAFKWFPFYLSKSLFKFPSPDISANCTCCHSIAFQARLKVSEGNVVIDCFEANNHWCVFFFNFCRIYWFCLVGFISLVFPPYISSLRQSTIFN